jgi:carbonic anhydrase/acetyltransferase-like protein (isoleucine patch superfamily)
MAIFKFEGKVPQIAASAFVHPEATIIGAVTVGNNCYVGAGARLRGDWGSILIGPGSNIQENVVIHSEPEVVTLIAENCHIGHGAIIHGARLQPGVLIGMGAILQEDTEIGSGCIIGSGALVISNTRAAADTLLVGVPAKAVGKVSHRLRQQQLRGIALYQQLASRMKKGLSQI